MKSYEIINSGNCHLETIESIIYYRDIITGQQKNIDDQITVRLSDFHDEYANYLQSIYPDVVIHYHNVELDQDPSENDLIAKRKREKYFNAHFEGTCSLFQSKSPVVDYQIHVTAGEWDLEKVKHEPGQYYICHQVSEKTKQYENVYNLTPINSSMRYFIADQLPFTNEMKRDQNYPIFLAQGRLSWRDMDTLLEILDCPLDFKVKILTREPIPEVLKKYQDKIIYKNLPKFTEYHREILNCTGILPLTRNEQGNPSEKYYKNTLTSTISYGIAYDLKFVIDEELNRIYNKHIKQSYVYKPGDTASIHKAIENSLNK